MLLSIIKPKFGLICVSEGIVFLFSGKFFHHRDQTIRIMPNVFFLCVFSILATLFKTYEKLESYLLYTKARKESAF